MQDLGLIPGLGRSPGEGEGYPLQYSGLENSMDCIIHGVTNSWTQLSDFHSLTQSTLAPASPLHSCALLTWSYQFSSVAQSYPTLCTSVHCSMPDFPVHHQLLELTQTHVHQVGDAIQPSHPLSSPSPPTFNLSQHHSLFQRVSSLHQVAKVLEFHLQNQSFLLIFQIDFLGLISL